ncbi:tetratricopeptide repeat protein [Streptacidiphilus melanogenes]|uniref:tetratricopeptide repeat protein n=1 Tax=Streptacidiphilus melanogenes TaxID=411235 RepID=UPI0005A9817B|nr:tetratricopeptide repeat protein [Streptacidiphilus melanogenes]
MSNSNEGRAEGHGQVFQASGDQHNITAASVYLGFADPLTAPGPDSVRHPAIGRTPVRLRDREELMAHLRAALQAGSGGQVAGGQVFVLHGLGGCGKTAVAHTLFQEATSTGERIGFWVNASDDSSLRAGMLAVGADRGAGEEKLSNVRRGLLPGADLVWGLLDRSEHPWLLVLDNADDPATLRNGTWLRSSPRGIVVVTTRQAATRWWPGAELHQVGMLPGWAAAQVLCDLAPHAGGIEEATAVAERLGRLPLALTLAGGYLANQIISPWKLSDYRDHLDASAHGTQIDLLDRGADTAPEARHLVSRTWQLNLDALARQGVDSAGTLLRLLACWSSDPLPLSLLAGARLDPTAAPDDLETALRGLLDQSLTNLIPGAPRCLQTHRLLLDAVAWSTPPDQHDFLGRLAASLLTAPLPEVPERSPADPRLTLLVPHVLALLRRLSSWGGVQDHTIEAAATVAFRLVLGLHRSGDYLSALNLATDATALIRLLLPDDHPAVLRLDQRVGRALQRLGRLEESVAVNRRVLEQFQHTLGPHAPDTLESLLGLGVPLCLLSRTDEGIPLIESAIAGLSTTLGSSHPSTLLAKANLLETATAPTLSAALNDGPALVARCVQDLGPLHTVSLSAELSYANALFRSGHYEAALPAAHSSLAAHEERFGLQYPITLAARSLVSRTLLALGRSTEAEEHAALVLAGRQDALGPEHPWTAAAQNHLATCRAAAGKH